MKILHIEDYDHEKGVDYANLLRCAMKNYNYTNVETLSDLEKEDVKKYDFFVIDGQFPKDKNSKPEVGMCKLAVEFLISCGVKKSHMVIWSNSTRTHQFAAENSITYFSKKEMNKDDYTEKKIDQKFIAKKADQYLIAKLLMRKNRLIGNPHKCLE